MILEMQVCAFANRKPLDGKRAIVYPPLAGKPGYI